MGRVVRVCGAGAVGVARDELLALLAFVVHRVAHCAGQRREEANERDAEDEDAAPATVCVIGLARWACRDADPLLEVEASASRDLWEESISLGAVVCFVVCLVCLFK